MFLIILVLLIISTFVPAQEAGFLRFSGQLAGWQGVQLSDPLFWNSGGRFVPELKGQFQFSNGALIDMEASLNINGSVSWDKNTDPDYSGQLKPYRVWLRYSTKQWELRAGLQKMNFGAAKMLRPLMWFDAMDVRDPLQLTDGVYGLLGRYYFDNNATIWAWGLTGNNRPKGYELAGSSPGKPEVGGRLQLPFGPGEVALSYHHRKVNPASTNLNFAFAADKLPENRIGFDGKWDLGVGVWVEASLTALSETDKLPAFLSARTDMINTGIDYTVPVGNGLGITLEYFRYHAGEQFFTKGNSASIVASMLTYPVSLLDNLSLMVFCVPSPSQTVWMNYLSWSRNYDNLSLYLIGFINPENYSLPVASSQQRSVFAGKGFQLMISYNF